MTGSRGRLEEIRETPRLAVPIAFAQVAMMTMGLVDAALVGRVSAVDLSAVSIGNALCFMMVCTPMGVTNPRPAHPLIARPQSTAAHDQLLPEAHEPVRNRSQLVIVNDAPRSLPTSSSSSRESRTQPTQFATSSATWKTAPSMMSMSARPSRNSPPMISSSPRIISTSTTRISTSPR